MLVETAHLHAYRAADDVYGAAAEGPILTYTDRDRTRVVAGHVGEVARDAIGVLISWRVLFRGG